jgi:molybdopterin converting factor small subunit
MTIILSGNLRRFTSFEDEIELDSSSVIAALNTLTERYPDLRPVLFEPNGKARSLHRFYLNGEVLNIGDTDHPLKPTDELGILTAIAGG